MDERSYEIAKKIEKTKDELGENLHELENKVKDATDWRKQFQKSPLTMIGIAFGGGILLSRVLSSSSRSHRRVSSSDIWDARTERTHALRPSAQSGISKAAEMLDNMKGALVGVAAAKVQQFLRSAVPGFHDEYSKTEHRKAPGRSAPEAGKMTEGSM